MGQQGCSARVQGRTYASIVHICKRIGDKSICDNHRGMSLLCIAGKILSCIPLNVADKFTYLGSTLSPNALVGDEISARIGKASGSLGKVTKRLWSERGVRLSTKIKVYCAVVPPTPLYGCEAWTPYRPHPRRLDQFHMRCLRLIANIKWQGMIPDTEVHTKWHRTLGLHHACAHRVKVSDDRIPQHRVLRITERQSSNTGSTTKGIQGCAQSNTEVMRHAPQHARGHRDRPCYLASYMHITKIRDATP